MSDLPEGWVETTLGEVVDYGKTEKVEPKNIPANAWILELEDIEKDTSRLLQRLTIEQRESKSTKNAFQKGDVLYGKLRPYLNKVIVADGDGFCTTEIIPIKPNTEIDGRYLFYWLKTPEFLNYVNSVSYGLNMPRLGTKDGLAAPLVLAPLDEQKRIAEKLDSLLTRVDSCERHLERVLQILKRFRQSVLAAATSGRLTEDWREENRREWQSTIYSIGDVGEVVTGSTPKKANSEYYGGEIPFYKPTELDAGYYVEDSTEHLTKLGADQARMLPERTVLVTCIGATIGKVGFARKAGATNQQINSVIANKTIVLPEYLFFWFASPIGQSSVIDNSSATTLPILNKSRFRELEIELPDLEEQAEIVRRVESLFAYTERLEARYLSASERVARLTPSLLAKGFRGELVGQEQG